MAIASSGFRVLQTQFRTFRAGSASYTDVSQLKVLPMPIVMTRRLCVVILSVLAVASCKSAASDCCQPPTWAASWGASPVAADPDPDDPLLDIAGQTVRQRARLSIGGEQLRIQLSNEFGTTPVTIGSATVALPNSPSSIRPESLKPLTFDGRTSVTIPVGSPMLSDPVDLAVAAGAEISISLYFPERLTTPTVHPLALKQSIISARGDFTHVEQIETQAVSEASVLLTAVLVPARTDQRVVVALGDSLTDGDASTVEADRSWPSNLARRFYERRGGREIAVVNKGIAGNRLLSNGFGIASLGSGALARFERDVLAVPGITHVIVQEGVNDLGFPGATLGGQVLAGPGESPTVEDVIAAYRQLIARAHVRGVKVIGATLTPFEGVDVPGYYSNAKETMRQAINTWIRSDGAFDGYIDFDAVLRDPDRPSRLQARYASADSLHPNDAGYQAMADAIDLSLFE
jgi:lysophospholipase L1-like esterase